MKLLAPGIRYPRPISRASLTTSVAFFVICPYKHYREREDASVYQFMSRGYWKRGLALFSLSLSKNDIVISSSDALSELRRLVRSVSRMD